MSEDPIEKIQVSIGELCVEVSGSNGDDVEERFNRVVDRMLRESSESKLAIRTMTREYQ